MIRDLRYADCRRPVPTDSESSPKLESGQRQTEVQVGCYRSRAVIDPRGVLRELGTEVAADVEVRVWDSTAEQRYLVLPERPAGTEKLSEEQLAALVTRDAMIGVAKVMPPQKGERR